MDNILDEAGQSVSADALYGSDAEVNDVSAEMSGPDIAADDADAGGREAETVHSADVERLIAEAEERGYKRGRNENIAQLMEQPASVDPELNGLPSGGEAEVLILANIRPSVWD